MNSDPKTQISKATRQPSGDEPEVEAHRLTGRWDVERAAHQPEGDEPEVEGHRARYFGTEQAVQPQDENSDVSPEVAGHGRRKPLMEQPGDNADDEVEGHLRGRY